MPTDARPIVYISYTSRKDDPESLTEDPKTRVMGLADRLCVAGFDVRFDMYFHEARHGFLPPQLNPGDQLTPWARWAGEQIRGSDFALLVCGPGYALNSIESPLGGTLNWVQWHALPDDEKARLSKLSTNGPRRVPYTWWDWHFMLEDIEARRARSQSQKLIPVGFGNYESSSNYIPTFVRGANYYNLTSEQEVDGLIRFMNTQFLKGLEHSGGIRVGRKRLIVVVPGLGSREEKWESLKVRLLQEPELAGSEWFYWDHRLRHSFGLRRAAAAARELSASIGEKWASAGGYDDIILIGHSMGGLLVRQAYLLGSGYKSDQLSRWATKVSKIVLFASINSGFNPSAEIRIFKPLVKAVLERTAGYPWLPFSDFIKGSNFITNLRIGWLRHFRNLESPPVVVQLLGGSDNIVATPDSADIDQFPGGYQIDIPGANHSLVICLDHIRDPNRREDRYRLIRDCILHPERQTKHNRPSGIKTDEKLRQVYFVLHGIRDGNNDWVQAARRRIQTLAQDPTAVVVQAPNQGYLSLLQFLLPTQRRRPSQDFKDAYQSCVTKYRNVEFHFLGHSNGTYQLGQALLDIPEMKFNRVVLAASVLPPDYPWHERFQSGQINTLESHMAIYDAPVGFACSALNAIGMRDIGTGGFTGFVNTGAGDYTPFAYYNGGHGAPVQNPALDWLVDHVLGNPSNLIISSPGQLVALPSGRRRLSKICALLAPMLVLAIIVGLVTLLINASSGIPAIITAMVFISIILLLLLY